MCKRKCVWAMYSRKCAENFIHKGFIEQQSNVLKTVCKHVWAMYSRECAENFMKALLNSRVMCWKQFMVKWMYKEECVWVMYSRICAGNFIYDQDEILRSIIMCWIFYEGMHELRKDCIQEFEEYMDKLFAWHHQKKCWIFHTECTHF